MIDKVVTQPSKSDCYQQLSHALSKKPSCHHLNRWSFFCCLEHCLPRVHNWISRFVGTVTCQMGCKMISSQKYQAGANVKF
ncbi:hypothetical protein AKO1_002659 [Acrasis kona]|uniref:Uncharacterized protein n=1 Tax=Acrasis kona TaxID=1008807 RepID=A0AAW2Z166_9EUKA